MGKALMKAGAIIAGAALIATGVGAAAGVGLLGASAAAVAGSAGTLTLFGVSVATLGQVGAGLTALGSLATKRPDVGTGGSPVQQTYDPQAGIPYAMGRTAVAGRIVYGTTTPENNKYRLFYSVLSGGGPIEGIEAFFANNEFVNFDADSGEGASGKYLNRMWQVRRLGAPGDAYLRFTATGSKDTPADHGGNPPEWTPAHKLSGYACALTACEYDAKKFTGDVQPLWIIYGVKVYDPRQDSTYPGGYGPCRAGDESTYVYSDSPPLHALTFALGRYQNGKRTLGFGFPLSSIIVSQFVEAANVADANGWKIGGTIYSTDDKWSVMQAMMQAGGGYCVPMGAQIGCVVNAPRVSIGDVTSADIIGEASAAGTKGRRDRINRVIPRYRSEDHNWEVVAAQPIEVAEHVTFDGGQRTREVDYTLVQDVIQAAQLARYDIENSREFEPVVFTLGPGFLGFRAGDCLTANVPELGLVDQELIVVRRSFDPASGAVSLECRSETTAKHAYCLGQTATPPPTPTLTPANYGPTAPNLSDWSAEGGELAGEAGSLPVIIVRGILDDVHAVSVIVDYRQLLDAGPPAVYGDWASQEFPASSLAASGDDPTVTIQLTGLVPGATYQVRVRYRTVRQVTDPAVNTDLGNVVTGGITAPSGPSDAVPPAAPSALSYESSLGTIFLHWIDPADLDVDKVEVWRSATNNRAAAVKLATVASLPSGGNGWAHSGLLSGVTGYYWVRAIDKSGNVSVWSSDDTHGLAATTDKVGFDDFPADLEAIGVVSVLPTVSGYTGPKTVRLTTNGKIYRLVSGAWVASVAAGDITGQLTDDQIADLDATKIAGQITATQISNGAISTPKLAAGSVVTSKLAAGAVTANEVAAGTLTGDRLVAGTISSAYIASGAILTDRLAANAVTAAKISSGTITADRLVVNEIDTQYIKNGALSNAGIVDLPQSTLISNNVGTYTNVSGSGVTFEVRNSGGSYTSVIFLFYLEGQNQSAVNDVGMYGDIVMSGSGISGVATLTGAAILVQPGNPANFCVPLLYRTSASGFITAVAGAASNGPTPKQLYVTRCKIVPIAIFKS